MGVGLSCGLYQTVAVSVSTPPGYASFVVLDDTPVVYCPQRHAGWAWLFAFPQLLNEAVEVVGNALVRLLVALAHRSIDNIVRLLVERGTRC